MGNGRRQRGLVFIVWALIAAFALVMVLALAGQRLLNNEPTTVPTQTTRSAK